MNAKRRFLLGWAVASGAIVTSYASAGDFWSSCKTDAKRNNCWPYPFVMQDRQAVRDPFAIMTDNGWRMQNTLGDPYFDPATQELTVAGQMKVKWIVTQTIAQRRTVFVLVGENQEQTQVRVDSVQQAIARVAGRGGMPSVLLTDRAPGMASGEYYDAVDRSLKESVPTPRLPTPTGGSGGSSSSGGGGGAGGS